MAITINHAKTDTIADWTQADLDQQIAAGNYPPGTTLADIVLPSDWNHAHNFTGIAASGANSDITSLSGLTGSITSPTYIGFNTSVNNTLTAGQLGWDGNNTLALGMAGNNVTQHIGEDLYFYCKATSAITKGQVVMFTGAVGASGVPTGAPATGITDGTYIMGIAAEDIANNGFGLIQSFGELRNVNTTGYADGDILWYNPAVTGGLTKTKPTAPNLKVQMAAVINGGSSGGGTILIRIDAGSVLGGTDSNVQITSPTTGQALVYNSGTTIWTNSNAVVMSSGSVDNSPIGATTPSTGKFTSVTTPSVTASSTDLTLSAISTGAIVFNTLNGTAFRIVDTGGSATNYWRAMANGAAAIFRSLDSVANAQIQTNGTGSVLLGTNAGVTQAAISHTASAVNYVQVTGAPTSGVPIISGQGSDTNVSLAFQTKGTGAYNFWNNGGTTYRNLRIDGSVQAVNYNDFYGSVAGNAIAYKANGSDTNISMAFQSKGTGAIDLAAGSSGVNLSNGGTVTAITRTVTGSGYTTMPTVTISPPTTAGGVQATIGTINVFASSVTVASGGTGYTLNDVLTVVGGTPTIATQLTVTGVSAGVVTSVSIVANTGGYTALPTNPASVIGGTGTGATFNISYAINTLSISNAGSGYIEQPTVTFSGGGGSGAAAYATVGGTTTIKTIGQTGSVALRFDTPSSITSNLPAMRILDGAAGYDSYPQIQPASAYTVIQATGNTNASLRLGANGSGAVQFTTNGTSLVEQLRVSHTASAVNYVQVTGAATTGRPVISVQGSDTNIGMSYGAKGTGIHAFSNGNGTQLVIQDYGSATVNRIEITPSATNVAPKIAAGGTDTNIDLALTPKGTGRVKFGTYTGTISAITGYIEILDAGGTVRRLAVVA